MANEFKVKNGLIVIGDLTTSGTITINGALAATQSWVTSQAYLTSASLSGYATQSYVTSALAALVDAAPAALDTLNELAAALGDDANFSTTITNSIASKLSLSGGTMTGQILFQTSSLNNGFRWDVNSDAAGITFKNTGDGDANSYFNFFTEDNANEYFKFSHNTWNIGSFDFMDVKNGVVRTNGDIYVNASQSGTRSAGTNELINGSRVWHAGDFSSTNISNWSTAYSWGNHASVGYITSSGSISGNAATATTFSTNRTNYKGTTDNAVAGQLMWKNYGNQHTIFDASQGTSPDGGSISNTNSQAAWSATYPTLMGWNGSQTYGVRVDSARIADTATIASGLTSMNISQFTNNSNYVAYGNYSWTSPVFGQYGIKSNLIDNVLYSAADRFEVFRNGVAWNTNSPFNLNYDSNADTIPANTSRTYSIILNTKNNPSYGIVYTEGNIYLSFYYVFIPGSVSGRVKDQNGVWRNIDSWTNVANNGSYAVWRGNIPSFNYMVEIEITINANSSNDVWFAQWEYVMGRPGQYELGIFNKAQDNSVWRSLYFLDSSNVARVTINSGGISANTVTSNNFNVSNAIYFGAGNNYLNWTNGRIYSNVGIETANNFYVSGNLVATQSWVQSQNYLTSYSETDTLATVTGRGATTTSAITVGTSLSITGPNRTVTMFSSSNYFHVQAYSGSTNGGQLWLGNDNDPGFYVNASQHFFRGLDSSNKMYINGTSGNVGIGTTSPGAKLEVATNATGTTVLLGRSSGNSSIKALADAGGYLALDSTGGGVILNHYSADNIWLVTGGGNVGVGTASPAAKLHVSSGQIQIGDSSSNFFGIRLSRTNSAVVQDAHLYSPSNNSPSVFYIEGGYYNSEAAGTVTAANSGYAYYERYFGNGAANSYKQLGFINVANGNFTSTNLVSSITMLSNGNVGIGTSSPGWKLHVAGESYTSGVVRIGGTSPLYFEDYGGGWFMSDSTWVRTSNSKSVWVGGGLLGGDGGLTIGYGGTTPPSGGAIIAGNVGIGNSSPGSKLSVFGNNDVFSVISQTGDTSFATRLLAQYVGLFNNGANGHHLYVSSTQELGPAEFNLTKTWGGFLTFGVSGDGTARTRALYVNSNGYVGVNVNPISGDRFEVAGSVRIHTGNNWDAIQIYSDGANGYIQGLGDETGLRIRSEYGNILLADNRGNVGIGTTSPQKKLDVNGTGIVASFGGTFSPGAFAGLHFGYSESASNNDSYKKSALVFERTDNHGQGGNASGKIHFLLNNIASASATSLSHSVMVIDTDSAATQGSARVGIGTTSPSTALTVNGVITATGGNSSNWNTAYSWGNHATAGYLTSVSDIWVNTTGDTMSGTLSFQQPVGLSFANGQYIKDNNTGGLIIYSGAAVNINGTTTIISNNTTVGGLLGVTGIVSANARKLSLGILDLNSGITPAQYKIKTNIPWNYGGSDFTVNIKGFRYGVGQMVSLSIGWHYYNNEFYNRNAISNGAWAPTISLAKSPDGYVIIYIPGPDYWPKLYVESVYSSNSADSYTSGWSWTDADLSDCTLIQTVPYKDLATNISGNAATATSATTAGALSSMNISQFTNNSGYITGYTETDTLQSVTSRGASTNTGLYINNNNPTLYLQDTDHRSAMIHVNSDYFYILNGAGTNSTGWAQQANSRWLFMGNLNNNDITFGGSGDFAGTVTASGGNSTNWNTAYSWGNHASAGYQSASTAITTSNIGSQSVSYANSAGYAGYVNNQSGQLLRYDNRTISPSETNAGYLQFGFTSWDNNGGSPYADYLHMRSYTDGSGGNDNLVMFLKSGIGMRIYQQTFGSATAYSSYADVWTSANFTSTNVSNWNTAYGWGNHASQSYATTSYVTTQINNLINGAPGVLDTLDELAAALGDDSNFATTVTNSIATKLPLAGGTMSGNLQVNAKVGTLDNQGIYLRGIGDATHKIYYRTSDGGNVWEYNSPIKFEYYNSGIPLTRLTLDIAGNLTIGGFLTESSSLKLKENVKTSEGNLEKVVNLRPVTYNKIGSQTTELGLIAEEVAEVYPEFVQYDENGEPVGVNYSRLTAALIGAVKELTNQVQELNKKING